MKKIFSKIKKGICKAIAWIFCIPMLLMLFSAVFFGLLVNLFDKDVQLCVNSFFSSKSNKSEKKLDDKIDEFKNLKEDLKKLIEEAKSVQHDGIVK